MLSILVQAEPLRGIPVAELAALIDRARACRFRAGSRMASPEDPSQSLHIILKGRVRVERAHPDLIAPVVLAEVGPGEVVAALEVLDGQPPRPATLRAIEETETLELGGRALTETVMQFQDLAAALLRGLSRSLQTPDQLVAQSLTEADRE